MVFFSGKRLQFSFGTFSKIQQDNTLAFTVISALIFFTYQHHQIYKFYFFEAFHFLLVKSELERREGKEKVLLPSQKNYKG